MSTTTPTLIVCFSGAGQLSHISNGARDAADAVNALNLPGVEAVYYRWVRNTLAVLSTIRAWLTVHPDGRIVIAGHSWGGWKSAKVAAALESPVYAVVLTDPVGREPLGSSITISSNVRTLWHWFQTEGRIHGSQIWGSVGTRCIATRVEGVPHIRMDSIPEWQNKIQALARGEL